MDRRFIAALAFAGIVALGAHEALGQPTRSSRPPAAADALGAAPDEDWGLPSQATGAKAHESPAPPAPAAAPARPGSPAASPAPTALDESWTRFPTDSPPVPRAEPVPGFA